MSLFVAVIPIALKSMVNSYVQRLEFRLESWPEDGVKIKDPHYEYMIYVVLPAVIGTNTPAFIDYMYLRNIYICIPDFFFSFFIFFRYCCFHNRCTLSRKS